jgi:hypothetical protein
MMNWGLVNRYLRAIQEGALTLHGDLSDEASDDIDLANILAIIRIEGSEYTDESKHYRNNLPEFLEAIAIHKTKLVCVLA